MSDEQFEDGATRLGPSGETLYYSDVLKKFVTRTEYEAARYDFDTPNEFRMSGGDLLECSGNLYSKYCFQSMMRAFLGEGGDELLESWAYYNTYLNILLYPTIGVPMFFVWILVIIPGLYMYPTSLIPPVLGEGYAELDVPHWIWYKLLSLDSQLVMPILIDDKTVE